MQLQAKRDFCIDLDDVPYHTVRYLHLLNDRRLHHNLKYTTAFSVFDFAQLGGFLFRCHLFHRDYCY